MILLFNGCSHTEGSQITSTRTWAGIVCKSLIRNSTFIHLRVKRENGGQTLTEYFNNIEKLLDKEKNYGISIAKSGKGNDSICLETIEAIEKLKSLDKKPFYVFIQWSGVSRRMFQLPNNKMEYINPWDNPQGGLPIDPLASELSIFYIKILQDYLNLNKIHYLFLPYMEFDPDGEYKKTSSYKSLDFSKIITTDGDIGKFITYFKENNLTVDEQGHPTSLGNWFLACKVIDKLEFESDVIGYLDFNKSTCEPTNIINLSEKIEAEIEVNGTTYEDWANNAINIGFKERFLFKSYKEDEKLKVKKIFG